MESEEKIASRIIRSPFGALLDPGHPDLWLPIGFLGKIEEPTSGVHFFWRGDRSRLGGSIRPYDSHIGQFLAPDFEAAFNIKPNDDIRSGH